MLPLLATMLVTQLLSGCEPPHRPPVAPATAAAATAADLPRLRRFLRWYLAFSERRDTSLFPLLNYVLPPPGPERQAFLTSIPRANISPVGYVTLNPRKARVFADSLRASGYFTAGFLARYEASLLRRGAALVADPQTENGVEPGFDADEVFRAQDLYEPAELAGLALAPARDQHDPAQPVYQLPVGSDRFLFYTRREAGQVAVDSIGLP